MLFLLQSGSRRPHESSLLRTHMKLQRPRMPVSSNLIVRIKRGPEKKGSKSDLHPDPEASRDFTMTVFNNPGGQPPIESEDCLYLNVFAPASPPPVGGRAVMFWIHGGIPLGLCSVTRAIETDCGRRWTSVWHRRTSWL